MLLEMKIQKISFQHYLENKILSNKKITEAKNFLDFLNNI